MGQAQRARLDAAAAGGYKYMDNATFDLRSAALGWLAATEALELAPATVTHIPLRLAQCEARDALLAAFAETGLDRDLLKRLGLYL